MKKFLLALMGIAVMAGSAFAQQYQEVVHLKNGSIIKGSIIEQSADGIKIQTAEGNVFVFASDEIQSQTQEKVTHIKGKKVLDLPKHYFGLRAGALFTTASAGDTMSETDDKICLGAHVGVVYNVAMGKTHRWYFQTGIDMQLRQSKNLESDRFDAGGSLDDCGWETQSIYLTVPAMFSRKCKLSKHWILSPSIGLAYTYGVWGEFTRKDYGYEEKGDLFEENDGNNAWFDRHAIDMKFSIDFEYKKLFFGIGGWTTIGDYSGFNVSIGCNF